MISQSAADFRARIPAKIFIYRRKKHNWVAGAWISNCVKGNLRSVLILYTNRIRHTFGTYESSPAIIWQRSQCIIGELSRKGALNVPAPFEQHRNNAPQRTYGPMYKQHSVSEGSYQSCSVRCKACRRIKTAQPPTEPIYSVYTASPFLPYIFKGRKFAAHYFSTCFLRFFSPGSLIKLAISRR